MKKEEKAAIGREPGAAAVEFAEIFVLATVIVICFLTFFMRLCVVDGPSMNNTLYDGELLLVSDFAYHPKEGDIIVFHQTSEIDRFNEPIVKRIIATGGKYVKIDYRNTAVYVSDDDIFTKDERLDESKYAYFSNGGFYEAATKDSDVFFVPEGSLFVLGDNRNNSADSRYAVIGMVDERRILGQVLLRFAQKRN